MTVASALDDVTAPNRLRRSGARSETFHVPGMHCGGCIATVEKGIGNLAGVAGVRANLSRQTVQVELQDGGEADRILAALDALGFPATNAVGPGAGGQTSDEERWLVRCVAVAGFAAANVMLLSLSIWAGNAENMAAETRTMFHWFSALIALPAIAYAGRPFFHSAWQALRRGRTNMDAPISLAVVLASGISLWETASGGRHAYFDSAITLLFFLLVGRLLDRRARRRVRSAAARLVALQDSKATRLETGGVVEHVDAAVLQAGDRLSVAAGERFAADGVVLSGASSADEALLTGESLPRPLRVGERVFAGTINLTGPLTIEATAVRAGTVLADIARLTDAAEQRKSSYVVLADRVSRLYAPVVHALALLSFVGWLLFGTAGWQPALMTAVAVLIITCPCALGLAVPVTQVVVTGRLFASGVLVKSGDALERLASVDTIIFDKTGTLTTGHLALVNKPDIDPDALRAAASLASASRHPLSLAIVEAAPETPVAETVREHPGEGLEWRGPDGVWRLGSPSWCAIAEGVREDVGGIDTVVWFTRPNNDPVAFRFRDTLRPDAPDVIDALKAKGKDVRIFSGDRDRAVRAVADASGIREWRSRCSPSDKAAAIEALRAKGKSVAMVGDGLNDAPALAAAAVSLSPGSAAEIAQVSADVVFQGEALQPVLDILMLAVRSQRLVRQNIGFAIGYNMVVLPLAVAGLVTPMIAALCMSSSSICVVLNAMRLARRCKRNRISRRGERRP